MIRALTVTTCLLAGCVMPAQSLSVERQLLIGCRAYPATLSTLARARIAGLLDEHDVSRVEAAIPILDAICTPPHPVAPVSRTTLARLQDALDQLLIAEAAAHGRKKS